MTQKTSSGSHDAIEHAGAIVAAYVANNSLPATELPALIASVHAALAGLAEGQAPTSVEAVPMRERPTAGQIRKSVQDDGLVSFIDGRSYKTLKRHLTSHGLDPRGYRDHYG